MLGFELCQAYNFKFQQSLSCHHFRQWWRRRVPHILGPCPGMDYQFPQSHISPEDVAEELLNPLERFLVNAVGAEEDPKEALMRLSQSRQVMCTSNGASKRGFRVCPSRMLLL